MTFSPNMSRALGRTVSNVRRRLSPSFPDDHPMTGCEEFARWLGEVTEERVPEDEDLRVVSDFERSPQMAHIARLIVDDDAWKLFGL